MKTEDRTVVITGANAGIGHHLMRALVEQGYRVAGLDVEDAAILDLQESYPERIHSVVVDVTDEGAVETAIDSVLHRWGRIDVLVNNAGIATVARLEDRSMDETRREFDVNLFGYLHTIRAVLPHMRTGDGGIIHNVGSPVGDLGHPGLTAYAASKGAVKAFTRSLRMELRGTAVSCSLVLPPTTDTAMTADMGYPAWMTADPAAVGRNLAAKITSTAPVIYPDVRSRIGVAVFTRFPRLWATIARRYVDLER